MWHQAQADVASSTGGCGIKHHRPKAEQQVEKLPKDEIEELVGQLNL